MTYDLLKLTVILGFATVPLLFLAQVFLTGMRRSATKRLTGMMTGPATTIQWRVRASAPALAVAALGRDFGLSPMQASAS